MNSLLSQIKLWIQIARPQTWGASMAPMMIVCGTLIQDGIFRFWPYLLCFVIAVSAQIASNFANDYFDYIGGKDTEDRVGFTRPLTTGAVSKRQMITALLIAVGICSAAGLLMALLSGWWVLLVGVAVLIGVAAYSAGPYPLSHHGLGDIAVLVYYGLVPVLTTYAAVGGTTPPPYTIALALGIGMWETNILVVNNYRDYAEDSANGKRTLIVRMGEAWGPRLYLINSIGAVLLLLIGLTAAHNYVWMGITAVVITAVAVIGNRRIRSAHGSALNGVLRFTSAVSILIAHVVMFTLLFH